MRTLRSIVAALIIVGATPAFAQERQVGRPVPSQTVQQSRGHYGFAYGYSGYPGLYGRFMYGRPLYGWPLLRPRTWLVADEVNPGGRPLGFSPNAFGYDSTAYQRPDAGWNGWPYHNTGGRDEELKVPPAPSAEADTEIEEGRARWREGDVSAALAAFKRAVAADLKSPAARLHMALALLPTGDLKNADKALASALDLEGFADEVAVMDLESLFKNAKARAKYEARLAPASDGTGTLTSALAHHLLGMKAKAEKLLVESRDPEAKKVSAALPKD